MKAWLVNIMWDALAMFAVRVHDWVFDPDRSARIRMKNRKRWWAYYLKAARTKTKRDDLRAKSWQIQFRFEVSPNMAEARGDIDPYRTH